MEERKNCVLSFGYLLILLNLLEQTGIPFFMCFTVDYIFICIRSERGEEEEGGKLMVEWGLEKTKTAWRLIQGEKDYIYIKMFNYLWKIHGRLIWNYNLVLGSTILPLPLPTHSFIHSSFHSFILTVAYIHFKTHSLSVNILIQPFNHSFISFVLF